MKKKKKKKRGKTSREIIKIMKKRKKNLMWGREGVLYNSFLDADGTLLKCKQTNKQKMIKMRKSIIKIIE